MVNPAPAIWLLAILLLFCNQLVLSQNKDAVLVEIHDFRGYSTNPPEKLKFEVPKVYRPTILPELFDVNLKLSSDLSKLTGMGPIRVLVRSATRDRMRSNTFLKRTQPKGGTLKNVPFRVDDKNGMEVYQYDYGSQETTLGTAYVFKDDEGRNFVAIDSRPRGKTLRIYRELNSNAELDYQIQKSASEHLRTIDSYIVKSIKAMQVK